MTRRTAWVVGGGPAGLTAAETLAAAGISVSLADSKPSIGRKFLMAGKSGLNLTKAEDRAAFHAAYGDRADWLGPMLDAFGPEDVQTWARGLGAKLFTGTTGRVFPVEMKASPLLRAWLVRLSELGVALHTRWRWAGWDGPELRFDTPDGPQTVAADVTVFAMGGASWSKLGSDGAWATVLAEKAVEIAPFAPANAGLAVNWSAHMAPHFGTPLKGVALSAGGDVSRGEIVLSARGIEGGGIYPLSPQLRQGASLIVDMLPDLTAEDITQRLKRPRGKSSWANHLRKSLKLSPAKIAILNEFGRPLPQDPNQMAALLKAVPVTYAGVRPMDEAISTAGGVQRCDLTPDLMFKALPGVFAAGEMLDWEAPTGGYLLTACLASGRWAGQGALRYLDA